MSENKGPDRRTLVPIVELWNGLRGPRAELSPQDRREVLNQLFFDRERRLPYLFRFFTLLSLSVAIATFGLLGNSTAVVIGAMLVAPLMTPIQAVAASLVMGWGRRQFQSLVLVVTGATWAVAASFLLGLLAPDPAVLPGEVLARTYPTLLDLGIALAAGAAGAYTLVRKESSAIPGVAVAVALVPPLAVVGITLEDGRGDLAADALLLFLTNLVAIVLAAAVMLMLTGFAPRALAERHRSLVHRGLVISGIAVILVALPLTAHTVQIVQDARDRHQIEEAIDNWIEELEDDFEVLTVTIDGNEVEIDIVGPGEPPGTILLNQRITSVLGEDAKVNLRWLQRNEVLFR